MKISKRGKEAFKYFSEYECSQKCLGVLTLNITYSPEGYTAEECFYVKETYGGDLLPCKEPELLARALQGKAFHGITIETCVKDFVKERTLFSEEINRDYPSWVANEIFQAAKKYALEVYGYIPTFVKNECDFSEPDKVEQSFQKDKENEKTKI